MSKRLPTGIDVLDRKLGGGIPAGSIVALTAPPASQAELFLYELTAGRRTLYLTLDRTEQSVADSIVASSARTGKPTIRYVSGDAPLDRAAQMVKSLPEESNLIIDPINILEEQEAPRYRNFLNELQNHIYNTGGLAVVHGLEGRNVPALRDTTEHMVDVIFQLETKVQGDQIVNKLAVPKFRGGAALPETIKLQLSERVAIDTSRDIA
ncbi:MULTISPECIES: RAD55 family ATPase [unclassified Haladaptatus]|uniref:RAD55 family ATPase n=1 Tax=unclassified Haladaptatus TaxID=2622732 RepID=UPI002FCE6704